MAAEYNPHPHNQTHVQYIHHIPDQNRNRHHQDHNPNAPSASKVVTILTLLPVGATLLLLAGLTLTGTFIGLALATPLFVIFSPVLVPAALAMALAVAGFVTSGAFGVTAVSALTWMAQYVRRVKESPENREEMENVKRRGQETMNYLGQKTKDAGQAIQNKAHDSAKSDDVTTKGRETVKSHDAGKANEGSKTRAAVGV